MTSGAERPSPWVLADEPVLVVRQSTAWLWATCGGGALFLITFGISQLRKGDLAGEVLGFGLGGLFLFAGILRTPDRAPRMIFYRDGVQLRGIGRLRW